jgi:hypothetical protein
MKRRWNVSPRRIFKSSYYFEELPSLKYCTAGFRNISTLTNRPHFYAGIRELLETVPMTLCRIPRKAMGSVLLYFLSITASICNSNICYPPWRLLILDSCTELTYVPLYICELHIRIPIVSTTNGYRVCNQAVNIGGTQLVSFISSNCSVSSFTHSWHI